MKKFLNAVCDFFVAWGEYRHAQAKKNQYRWY